QLGDLDEAQIADLVEPREGVALADRRRQPEDHRLGLLADAVRLVDEARSDCRPLAAGPDGQRLVDRRPVAELRSPVAVDVDADLPADGLAVVVPAVDAFRADDIRAVVPLEQALDVAGGHLLRRRVAACQERDGENGDGETARHATQIGAALARMYPR